MPSMSVPRWVWASKRSRSSGRSSRSRSSHAAATCRARSSASTKLNLAVRRHRPRRRECVPIVCRLRKGHCRPRAAVGSKGAVMSSRIGGSMKRIHLLVLLVALLLAVAAASARGSGSGSIVLGEVFAAGGNSGAPYANDYVELFNRGASAVAIDGWTLQYASASSTTWQVTALSGTIPAGGRYLVQLASGGGNGAPLPTPD